MSTTQPEGATPSATSTPTPLLFPDLPNELAATRRMLERVPDGHSDWRPHPKSMSLGRLATHIAELPRLTTVILTTDELDWSASDYKAVTLPTTAEILATFDGHAAAMQSGLAAADWAALTKRWSMRSGDQVFMDGQKGTLIRSACISHLIHHRSQLGVYLRLLGVAVPGMYGPSADEM